MKDANDLLREAEEAAAIAKTKFEQVHARHAEASRHCTVLARAVEGNMQQRKEREEDAVKVLNERGLELAQCQQRLPHGP